MLFWVFIQNNKRREVEVFIDVLRFGSRAIILFMEWAFLVLYKTVPFYSLEKSMSHEYFNKIIHLALVKICD